MKKYRLLSICLCLILSVSLFGGTLTSSSAKKPSAKKTSKQVFLKKSISPAKVSKKGKVRVYAKIKRRGKIKVFVTNARNKIVAKKVFSKVKAGGSIAWRWDLHPTKGNKAGLSVRRVVPAGKYKVKISSGVAKYIKIIKIVSSKKSSKSTNKDEKSQQGDAKIKSVNVNNYVLLGDGSVSMTVRCTKTGKVKTALNWHQVGNDPLDENGADFVMKRGKTYEVTFPTVGYRTIDVPGALITIRFGKFGFFCGKSEYNEARVVSGIHIHKPTIREIK